MSLKSELKKGTKIKLGVEYCNFMGEELSFKQGDTIELVEGYFEEYNGLYSYESKCPSILVNGEFESIYHLFGNELEYFKDCEIVTCQKK